MKEEYENFTLIFLDSLINKLLRKLSENYDIDSLLRTKRFASIRF